MLSTVAKAAQALAVWRYVESSSARDQASPADLKAHSARAHGEFLTAAASVAFELVPALLDRGEVITKNEVRYSATAGGGGFIVQKMNLEPENPGVLLIFDQVSLENWLQLMIDLPELLEVLKLE